MDLPNQYGVLAVDLIDVHLDDFVSRGGQVLPNVVCPNGQLAMSPVDQNREADGPGSAEVENGVERGPDGSPRVQNVVDQHHDAPVDIDRDGGRL